jgi:hypothetical protein
MIKDGEILKIMIGKSSRIHRSEIEKLITKKVILTVCCFDLLLTQTQDNH